MESTDWHKPRQYKHFDGPVSDKFLANVKDAKFVAQHAFSPLIRYYKQTKRYKPKDNITKTKNRPIMYASHRDACILSYYTNSLNMRLGEFYNESGLSDFIIAYRALGRANYHFSADVYNFALANSPCVILAFDVSGFFDNLDHGFLKSRLKRLLGVSSLAPDWLRVLRAVTRYHYVDLDELKTNPAFAKRLKLPGTAPIATVQEIKAAAIRFQPNEKGTAGIPQGTPISAALSNLYMMDFDVKAAAACTTFGALYRRYSDDILVVCSPNEADRLERMIETLVADERLDLSADKTERTFFDARCGAVSPNGRCAQYLGFVYYPGGAGLRPSSLSRQWRKMKRSVARTRKAAESGIAAGRSTKVFTKKLRRRFSPLRFRNFSSYARRSAKVFGTGEKITKQVRRFERFFEREVRSLQSLSATKSLFDDSTDSPA